MYKLRKKEQAGFTLLEMLVVLLLMGFMVAMIAPRLSNVFATAQQTMCRKSQQTLSQAIDRFVAEEGASGKLPDNLVSLTYNNDGTYEELSIYDPSDPATEGNDLINKFKSKNVLTLHALSGSEAKEIKKLGIKKVHSFKETDGDANTYYIGDEISVDSGVKVLMIGGGAAAASGNITVTGQDPDMAKYGLATNKHLINPEWAYRIVLGLGPDNGLITSGKIENLGIGMGHASFEGKPFQYCYHNLVLPRLEATISRLPVGAPITIDAEGYDEANGTQIMGKRTYYINKAEEVYDWGLLGAGGYRWQEWSDKADKAEWKITVVTTL